MTTTTHIHHLRTISIIKNNLTLWNCIVVPVETGVYCVYLMWFVHVERLHPAAGPPERGEGEGEGPVAVASSSRRCGLRERLCSDTT